MQISIATTATGIVVKDLATGLQLTWVDEVSIAYSSCVGRTVTYLATYSDTKIDVIAAPPDEPATPPTPATPTAWPTSDPTSTNACWRINPARIAARPHRAATATR